MHKLDSIAPSRGPRWGRGLLAGLVLLGLTRWSSAQLPPVFPPAVPVAPIPTPAAPPIATEQAVNELIQQNAFCLIIGERFANRFVQSETVEEGPVQDCLLGAQVTGTQQTRATSSLDIIPHDGCARLAFVLDGTTNNQTVSVTRQAAIRSEGNYRFQLSKLVEFDGHRIRTWGPSAFLTVNQRHLGAMTPVSTIPLLGPLANMAALNAAEQRKPMSQMIAARRVTEMVAPEFNGRIDQFLGSINDQLEQTVEPKLTEWRVLPAQITTRSTNDAVLLGVNYRDGLQLMNISQPHLNGTSEVLPTPDGLSAPPPLGPSLPNTSNQPRPSGSGPTGPSPAVAWSERVTCLIHESMFNHFIAQSPLAGLELPDSSLQQLLDRGLKNDDDDDFVTPQMATLVFDTQQPASISLTNNEIILEFRVGFRPILGPAIPTQIIRIAVTPTLTMDELTITPELRSITPLDPESSSVATIAENIIREAVRTQLEESTIPRTFPLPTQRGTVQSLRIADLSITDGWLHISMEAHSPQ